MIIKKVKLSNSFDSKEIEVVISKEDINQLACNKANGMYDRGYWNYITTDNKFTLKYDN